MNIAEIGFSANTSALDTAKQKLEALPGAAGRAERAADKLAKIFDINAISAEKAARADNAKAQAALSAARASDTATKSEVAAAAAAKRKAQAAYDAAKAATAEQAAVRASAAAVEKETAAIERNTAAKRRANSVPSIPYRSGGGRVPSVGGGFGNQANPGNIAAQFQDIGVTAAMGMNPLLIALQQGTQLSMALQNGVGGLGAAFKQLLGPTALITIGLVALAAAGLQMVNWVGLAQWALNGLAEILPTILPWIAAIGAALTVAFAPSIIGAITGIATAISGVLYRAILGLVTTIGIVPTMLAALIAGLFIFRDELTNILGFDIIDVAKKALNWIIGGFVGAFNAIKATWSALPGVIGDVAISAANAVINAINKMVSAAVNGINALIDAANEASSSMLEGSRGGIYGKGLAKNLLGAGGGVINRIERAPTIPTIDNPFAGQGAAVGETIAKSFGDAQGVDYVGKGIEAVGNFADYASGKVRKLADSLDDVDKKKKKGGGKTDGEKFDDIVNGAERSIAALQAERSAVGMSELETAKLRRETELLNEARQKGIDLSPQQRDQLIALAHGMAELEIQTKRAKESLDFQKDAVKGFLSDLRSGLMEGKSLWESFAGAVNNVLDKIIDKLLNNLVDAIFEVNSATSSGGKSGGGGLFGSLFGWIGKLFSAKGNVFDVGGYATEFANGGAFTNSVVSRPTAFTFAKGGALGVMGEAGPEAIMPLTRGPDGSLGVQMYGNGAAAQPVTQNNVTIAQTYKIEGAVSSDDVKGMVRQGMHEAVDIAKNSMAEWNMTYGQDGAFA